MKHTFQRRALAAVTGAVLGAVSVEMHAQTHAPSALDDITITASPPENRNLMVPAQQLSGAALVQRQSNTLGETLNNLPGVANSSFGPNVGRPSIRGMDSDRIRILQNSGANMDVSGLSNDHAVPIDPLTTERIEVLRGPATLLYGGSAMGGVVNVIDNRIARERMFDAQGGVLGKVEMRVGGAANERSTSALLEAGDNKMVLHVDAFERSTQNLQVPKNMTCGEAGSSNGRRVCNSASDSSGAAVGGTLLFDRGHLGLSTSEYRSSYGTVAEPTVTIGMMRRHHVMEGQWRGVGNAFEHLKFQMGHTNYTHTEYDAGVAGTRFDNLGDDLRLEARQHAWRLENGSLLEGVVGWQRERNDLQATGDERFLPSSRTQSTGVFTYQALRTTWGQVSASARADNVAVRSLEAIGPNNDNPAQTRQFKPVNVAIGALRTWREGEAQNGWQMSGNLSANQRAPKDYELFAHGVHVATHAYQIGQPTNGLEKGKQLDVGGEYKYGPHTWGVTVFASEFSNYLSLLPTGADTGGADPLPIYRFEGVRARFDGMESSAKIRMVGGQSALLRSNASLGTMDLEMRADTVRAKDLTHDSYLPRIAPVRMGADVVWSRDAWGARFGFMHAAAQNRVPNNGAQSGVTTAAYTLWNAALNYHMHQGQTHWFLFAKLDNLTNQLAYASTSVLTQTMGNNAPPLAGRSLKVGAQVSF